MVGNDDKKYSLDYLETFIYTSKKAKENDQKIILIHGFYIDHRCFQNFYSKMKKNYECIAFNLPGCGTSKIKKYPMNYLNITTMAKLIAKYIKENKLKNITLIGHSLGAAIAAMVCNELTSKIINKLILLAPFNITSFSKIGDKVFKFNIDNKNSFINLQKLVFSNYDKALHSKDEEKYYQEMLKFNERNHKYAFTIMFNMTKPSTHLALNNAYKSLKIPTYLMISKKDQFVNFEWTKKYLLKQINKLNITEYKSGHAFFIEERKKFFDQILGIMNE